MFGALLQLLFAAALGAVGAVAMGREQGAVAGICLAIAGVLTVSLVRYGGVMAAGRHYRAGRKSAAWRELGLVPLAGRLLARQHRAYYGLLRTACRMDRAEWSAAIEDARRVLEIARIPPANHATAHAAIARCSLELGDHAAAADHLARARSLPRKPQLDRLLAEVEAGLSRD